MSRVAYVCFVVLLASAAVQAETIRSGSLRVDVGTAPFSLTFVVDDGPVLSSALAAGTSGPSALSVRTQAGWIHATTVSSLTRKGSGVQMMLQTSDPGGGTFVLRIRPDGEGVIELEATPGAFQEVLGIGSAWVATPDERFYGLGERSDTVQHRGARVESYVSDGPWI